MAPDWRNSVEYRWNKSGHIRGDAMEPFLWSGARSLKSGLVLPTQIFGLFGPPKKRVNFDKFNQRQKCVFCVLNGSVYVSRHETCYVVIT